MNTSSKDSAGRIYVDSTAKAAPILRSSAKPLKETARIKIPIKVERIKPLAQLTASDIPPGLSPEDVAIDVENNA
jgi:hypothetical protein